MRHSPFIFIVRLAAPAFGGASKPKPVAKNAARQSEIKVQVGVVWTPNGRTDYTQDKYASLTLKTGTTTLPVLLNYTAANRLFSVSVASSPYLTVSKGGTGYVTVQRSHPDGTAMSVNLTVRNLGHLSPWRGKEHFTAGGLHIHRDNH